MVHAKKVAINEVFAIRDGEMTTIHEQQPESGRWIAVQARRVMMPKGPCQQVRQTDGAPVEQAAIVACQLSEGKWQWVTLSAPTKETIGDLLFDGNAERDTWYYAAFTDTGTSHQT